MSWFKKTINNAMDEAKTIDEAINSNTSTPEPEEEWVWVEGYKGTDMNMQCKGYQYELNKQYDMPWGEEVKECKSGFHLCLTLNDVFGYYSIGAGNRFFKVRALVKKSDKDEYGTLEFVDAGGGMKYYTGYRNKLVAKSIIFISELTMDEILKGTDVENLSLEYKQIAIASGIKNAIKQYQIDTLVEDGYSMPFASFIAKDNKFEIAHAVGSQKDLSMDMKVLAILNFNNGGKK